MVRLNLSTETIKRERPRHRRIRAISIAPALLTLGNLLSGFAAVHFASRPEYIFKNTVLKEIMPTNLALACYLIFLAMICDALDGRMARFARMTSDFGAQLDSLADIVSFGVAPAFIAIRLVMKLFPVSPEMVDSIVSPAAATAFGRFCWFAAGAYVSCAALRLARFNAENVPDESAHMSFKGLPTPGAAGALISVVLLSEEVIHPIKWLAGYTIIFGKIMPWVCIALGLLMVSRIPYIHLVNRFLRGKKPFWMLVFAAMAMLGLFLWWQLMIAIILCGYAMTGPVVWVVQHVRHKHADSFSADYGHKQGRE
jgi:CDP-diacylglycerol--serine O-phosphatidyltransferase